MNYELFGLLEELTTNLTHLRRRLIALEHWLALSAIWDDSFVSWRWGPRTHFLVN